MYLYRDQAQKIIQEFKNDTISELKKNHEFMISLLTGDDWSLVIKSHALVESIINYHIVAVTDESRLKYLIERLPMHDKQIGKLLITKKYGLLDDSQRKFVIRLSEIRNKLVHNFENISFDFVEYVESLDSNQRKSWVRDVTWHAADYDAPEIWREIAIENPKVAVWFSVLMFVSLTTAKTVEVSTMAKIREIASDTVKKDFKGRV